MRQVQVIPQAGFRLYGAIVAKEVELSRKSRGTFRRSGRKEKNRTKWKHANFRGWIQMRRGLGEVVQIEVNSKKTETEWQLFHAILGFLDRHFAEKIRAINIQYAE